MSQVSEPAVESDGILRRIFPADLSVGDGRTVDVRVVPYGERITHNDGLGGVPEGVPYEEEWVAGAFAHQTKAANRVLANFEHKQFGLVGVVGHGKSLLERADGLYGSFRIHPGEDGDKLLMLIDEQVVDGVSMEARPVKHSRSAEGVVRRTKGHLVNIAFCRAPAFQGARILAVREQAGLIPLDAALLPVEPDPELLERCRALGIAMPQRYEAHPEESDTPDETGTPDEGTRPSDDDNEEE